MEFKTAIAILWRRKTLFLGSVFAVVFGALAALLLVTRQYEVKAVVFVQPSETISSLMADMSLMNAAGVNLKTDLDPENIVQMASLEPLVEKAATLLQIRDSSGELRRAKEILKYRPVLSTLFPRPYLKVSNSDDTQLFEITVYSADPDEAVMLADTMADMLKAETLDLRIGLFEDAGKQLDARITKQLGQYKQILLEIQELQHKDDFLKLDFEIEAAITKMSDLIQSREQLSSDMAGISAKIDALRKQIKKQSPETPSGDVLKDNSYISMLRDELTQHEIKLRGLEASFTANHPDVIALKRQIEQVKKELASSIKSYGETSSELQSLQRDREAAQAKIASVDDDIAKQRDVMSKLPGKAVSFNILEQRMLASSTVLSSLLSAKDKVEAARNMTLSEVRVVQKAQVDDLDKPERPKKLTTLAIAGFLGLCLAFFAVYVREQYDDALRDADDAAALGLEVLARIPRCPKGASPLLCEGAPEFMEAFRFLKNALSNVLGDENGLALVVASPERGEGRSVTAANLALALARAGKKTACLEADLRSPSQRALFGAPDAPGLSAYLAGRCEYEDLVGKPVSPNLSLIQAGRTPEDPGALIESERTAALVERLRREFDAVIIDAPPSGACEDALLLCRHADAALLVARAGTTSTAAMRDLLARFKLARARIAGLVYDMF